MLKLGKYSVPKITDNEVRFGAYYIHNEIRSKKARDVDNGLPTKNVTTNIAKWMLNPNRNDLQGIDTKKRSVPKGYSQRKGKNAANKLMNAFWDQK